MIRSMTATGLAVMTTACLAACQQGEDGYTAEHHFDAMLELGAEPDLVARMQRFATEVVEDSPSQLRAMGTAVGIEAGFEDGQLVSFDVPDTAR